MPIFNVSTANEKVPCPGNQEKSLLTEYPSTVAVFCRALALSLLILHFWVFIDGATSEVAIAFFFVLLQAKLAKTQ